MNDVDVRGHLKREQFEAMVRIQHTYMCVYVYVCVLVCIFIVNIIHLHTYACMGFMIMFIVFFFLLSCLFEFNLDRAAAGAHLGDHQGVSRRGQAEAR